MEGTFVCGICGRICNTLSDYMEHVNKCSVRVMKEEAEKKERLEKLNAEIEEVKKAKAVIAKFKKEHPEEYNLNFGGHCSCGKHKEENTHGTNVPVQPTVPKMPKELKKKRDAEKEVPETVELFFEDDGNGKPKLYGKINGEEVDFNDAVKKHASSVSQSDFFNWIMSKM